MQSRLKEIRKEAGLTLEQFGSRLGVSKAAISRLENGSRTLTDQMIISVCREFKINEEWLRTGRGTMKNELPDAVMEQLKATYKLSSLEYRILEKYFSLPDTQRDSVREFIQELFEEQEKTAEPTRVVTFYPHLASAGCGQVAFDDLPSNTIEIANTEANRKVVYAIGVNGDSMEPELYDGDVLLIEYANDVEVGETGIFLLDGEVYVKKRGENSLISLNKAFEPISLDETARCMGRVAGVIRA